MIRGQALEKACFLLREQAKEESLARFLLMYLLEENSMEFSNNLFQDLDEDKENKYFSLINLHIEKNAPLSHLLGFDYFYERKFNVTKDVLSPRMETEELVYYVLDYINKEQLNNINILDLCTGSGIIAITLKKELENKNIEIDASDISNKALEIAKKNSEELSADINFINSNIFDEINNRYDIIVSNPPYISYADKKEMDDNVLKYDPHLALFAEDDGLYFYKKIIAESKYYLKPNGKIFFEIGYNQGDSLLAIAKEYNFSAKVVKDINGKDRIVILENFKNKIK